MQIIQIIIKTTIQILQMTTKIIIQILQMAIKQTMITQQQRIQFRKQVQIILFWLLFQ